MRLVPNTNDQLQKATSIEDAVADLCEFDSYALPRVVGRILQTLHGRGVFTDDEVMDALLHMYRKEKT